MPSAILLPLGLQFMASRHVDTINPPSSRLERWSERTAPLVCGATITLKHAIGDPVLIKGGYNLFASIIPHVIIGFFLFFFANNLEGTVGGAPQTTIKGGEKRKCGELLMAWDSRFSALEFTNLTFFG
jgi:hypothetical protein